MWPNRWARSIDPTDSPRPVLPALAQLSRIKPLRCFPNSASVFLPLPFASTFLSETLLVTVSFLSSYGSSPLPPLRLQLFWFLCGLLPASSYLEPGSSLDAQTFMSQNYLKWPLCAHGEHKHALVLTLGKVTDQVVSTL